ncbi:MAG: beta-ketoacyl-[acyl-carrier-protein] synthase family protein [Planctomycetes bacterium]|nr:beta-ketoacyl-[acyl-carrier-protein] synthase family protein [Planctomycetota bacterium]
MYQLERVVVTGVGLATPIGFDEGTVAEHLFAGRSAIGRLRCLDASLYKSQSSAEVDAASFASAIAARGTRPGDRTSDLALIAAGKALEQARLLPATPGSPGEETCVLVGTGSGPSHALQESWQTFFTQGGKSLRPTTVPRCMLNAVSSAVSIQYGLKGTNYVIVSACSSSTIALGIAFRMIRSGDARRVLVVGSESMFTPALYASWDNLGVMSRNAEPSRACRPFDAQRDGFVLGEGAGALLLEERGAALERGATLRAEVLGFGESSDGTHITRPSVDGQALCMRNALRSARLEPDAVDFVNAHGTATKANDATEAEAIRKVFGARTEALPVNSSKSYFGHLLGAAGIVETIASILCLEHGRLHANLNLEEPDPVCNLRLTGLDRLEYPPRVCLKNSFGFGGSNSTLILARPSSSPS